MEGPLHRRMHYACKKILGPDIEMDFDMLIYKAPHSDSEFPWHQDEAYWRSAGLEYTDIRTLSAWCSLDDITKEIGGMRFCPTSHKIGVFNHKPVKPGHHTLTAIGHEECVKKLAVNSYIKAGSASFHTGRTLHGSGKNVSDHCRRAFITNWKPKDVIKYQRDKGFDHLKDGFANHKTNIVNKSSKNEDYIVKGTI